MTELVVRSQGEERLFRLDEDSVVIGRAPGCAIEIDDIHSSRRHCQIIRVKGGFEVVDLKSRNGILVNGAQTERKVLRHGDVVKIGDVEIVYQTDEEQTVEVGADVLFEEVEETPAAAPSGSVCSLQYHGGDRDGTSVPLSADRTTIGRKSSNTIVVKDQMVSTYHCEVAREGTTYILRDLGSTNGTYVNNEPVTEMALNHGARVRVGATRLIFLDPSMAEFDASLDVGDDAGEWGMMREIDAAAVPRRRIGPGGIIGLLLIVGMVGAGAYLITSGSKARVGAVGPEAPAENRLPYYSFELGEGEILPLRVPAGAAVDLVKGGHQGKQAVRVSRGERKGDVAARYDPKPADDGVKYRVVGWIRTGEGAAATIRIGWRLGEESGTTWLASTAPIIGGGGWRKTEMVVSPPPNARQFAVQLVLLEGESANFDDVAIIETSDRSDWLTMQSGPFEVAFDECGCIGISREGRWALLNGSPIARLADGRVLDARAGFASVDRVEEADGGAVLAGSLPDLAGGEPLPFVITLRAEEEHLVISLKMDAVQAGLRFATPRALLEEAMFLQGPTVRDARYGAFEKIEGLERITFGSGGMRLGAAAGADLGVSLSTGAGQSWLTLDAPVGESGVTELRVRTSFGSAAIEASELLRKARRLEEIGKDGEAFQVCQEIILVYSFQEAEVRGAQAIAKTIEERARGQEAEARASYAAGKAFLDDAALGRAEELCTTLAERWKGDARGEAAATLLQTTRKLRAERASDAATKQAASELARATGLRATDQARIAAAVYRSIIRRFGATSQAEEARTALREMGFE